MVMTLNSVPSLLKETLKKLVLHHNKWIKFCYKKDLIKTVKINILNL